MPFTAAHLRDVERCYSGTEMVDFGRSNYAQYYDEDTVHNSCRMSTVLVLAQLYHGRDSASCCVGPGSIPETQIASYPPPYQPVIEKDSQESEFHALARDIDSLGGAVLHRWRCRSRWIGIGVRGRVTRVHLRSVQADTLERHAVSLVPLPCFPNAQRAGSSGPAAVH